ncbi:MAG: FAD-binding oxidoreductase [Solirubrobacterales bacterium]
MSPEAAVRKRKHWGWGFEDQQPRAADLSAAAAAVRERLGFGGEPEEPVPLEAIELPEPRLRPPASLAEIVSDERHERVSQALGKAYRDVVRGFRGVIEHPPDLVARPRDEAEIEAVLGWCADEGAAAIPYGGGTSVVGGVEPRVGDGYAGSVSLDLRALDRVLEVDPVSRAARIQAGVLGPALNDQLAEHGLTLRHFPQSFEYSSLGGWIATRAGGHFATVWTHIDDLVESVRALTPSGAWESRRLPGSGAGPSPDRMLIGSEGILGVITEAWVRVHERPTFKLSCGVAFEGFGAGAAAVRELAQSGLNPANCRLLDTVESEVTGAGAPGKALLVLGFESAHHPVDEPMRVAVAAARDHGGEPGEVRGQAAPEPRKGAVRANSPGSEPGSDPVGSWRHAFLAAPYLRDTFVACGVLSDTFETAITWDRFDDFHAELIETARRAVAETGGGRADGAGAPKVSCRFTHVYPDGPAPYFTVLAPARRGSEVEQWDEIKAAVSDAVIAAGGTITHHHAVGRDHRPWYDRQRPDPFADALRAAKRAVDPAGTLNPGVLIDP